MNAIQGIEKLSIIIPVFNEAASLRLLIDRVQTAQFPIDYEIIIVDDFSEDETLAIAQSIEQSDSARIKLLRNPVNRGKGACIRQALEHVNGRYVVVQDGDLEYDPCELPLLLQPLLEGSADVVYGSRFLKQPWPESMALPNWVANRFLTFLFNRLFVCRLTDLMTCYKVMPVRIAQTLEVDTERFGFDPEMSAKIALGRHRIAEVPISYRARTHREGKKISWRDFFSITALLFRIKRSASKRP